MATLPTTISTLLYQEGRPLFLIFAPQNQVYRFQISRQPSVWLVYQMIKLKYEKIQNIYNRWFFKFFYLTYKIFAFRFIAILGHNWTLSRRGIFFPWSIWSLKKIKVSYNIQTNIPIYHLRYQWKLWREIKNLHLHKNNKYKEIISITNFLKIKLSHF